MFIPDQIKRKDFMPQIIIDIDQEDVNVEAIQELYDDIQDLVDEFEIENDTTVELEIS